MTVSRLVALSLAIAAAGGLIACKRSAIDEAGNTLRVDPSKPQPAPAPYPRPQPQSYDEQNTNTLAATGHVDLKQSAPPPRRR